MAWLIATDNQADNRVCPLPKAPLNQVSILHSSTSLRGHGQQAENTLVLVFARSLARSSIVILRNKLTFFQHRFTTDLVARERAEFNQHRDIAIGQ